MKLLLALLVVLAPRPGAAQAPSAPPPVSLSAGAQVYADCSATDLATVQVSILIHVAGGQTDDTDAQSGAGTQCEPTGKLVDYYWDSEASGAWALPALDLDAVRVHMLPIRPGSALCRPIVLYPRTTRGQGSPLRVMVKIPAGYHYRSGSAEVGSVQISTGHPTMAWAAPPLVEPQTGDTAAPTQLVLSLPEARPDLYSPAFYSVSFVLDKDGTTKRRGK